MLLQSIKLKTVVDLKKKKLKPLKLKNVSDKYLL